MPRAWRGARSPESRAGPRECESRTFTMLDLAPATVRAIGSNLVPGFAAVARDGEAQREGYQVALLGAHAPRTGKQGAARHDKGR